MVRIDLKRGTTPEFRTRLGNAVRRAMGETIGGPADDRLLLIAELDPGGPGCDPAYFGSRFGNAGILIQVTLDVPRTLAEKKAFCVRVGERLAAELGVRSEEVFINLVEVARDDWFFGHGIVRYAD